MKTNNLKEDCLPSSITADEGAREEPVGLLWVSSDCLGVQAHGPQVDLVKIGERVQHETRND